ncbi:MAG: hypothetical protein AAF235_05220, partial [Planctomycetota bacterium]
ESKASASASMRMDVLEEATVDDLDMRGVGRAVALTPNAEVNTLVLQRFERMFGKASVFRIPVRRSKPKTGKTPVTKIDSPAKKSSHTEHGRRLFSDAVDLVTLEKRLNEGWVLRSTTLTTAFDYTAYQTLYGLGATVMFVVNTEDSVRIVTSDSPAKPVPGDTVIAMVDPDQLVMAMPALADDANGATEPASTGGAER